MKWTNTEREGLVAEQFELQKPISELFSALKSYFVECEPFSYWSFRTTEQNPLFQKTHFCDVITYQN